MALTEVIGYPVGLARLMLWEVGQSGAEQGQCLGSQATLANGSASPVLVVNDVETANFQLPEPERLDIKAGDKIVATVTWGGAKLSPFDVTGPAIASAINQIVTDAKPNTTNSLILAMAYNENRGSPKVLGGALQQRYQLKNGGGTYYRTTEIPLFEATYRVGGMTYRGVSNASININPIRTDKAANGQGFGTGAGNLDLNLEDDLASFIDWYTPHPFHIMAFRDDGTETEIDTTYKPLNTVITLNATENRLHIAGVATALASITTAGVATKSAAGSAGTLNMLCYPTLFVPA